MHQLNSTSNQNIIFSKHAESRLAERSIKKSEVESVLLNGTSKTTFSNTGLKHKYNVPRSVLVDLSWRSPRNFSLSEIRNLNVVTANIGNKKLVVTAYKDEESFDQFDARRRSSKNVIFSKN